MRDARGTRAARELRTTVFGALSHEAFRALVSQVYSVGPAPRSPAAAQTRTGGAWRQPGRGAFTRDRHDGQVSRPATRIDTQRVSPDRWQCPEALYHRAGADGRCEWCHRRVAWAMPRPELGSDYRTILGDAYRYHYEPDWGSERDDL